MVFIEHLKLRFRSKYHLVFVFAHLYVYLACFSFELEQEQGEPEFLSHAQRLEGILLVLLTYLASLQLLENGGTLRRRVTFQEVLFLLFVASQQLLDGYLLFYAF
jgi:hypothetical protein